MVEERSKIESAAAVDVVIAGGGLVGGSLAIALAEAGIQVSLIEAVEPDSSEQPSFDDRMIALSHSSCKILRSLGLWAPIEEAVWPIDRIHISEQARFGTSVIDAGEQGIRELGHVIKARELGVALWHRINELEAINVLCPARVVSTARVDSDTREVRIQSHNVTRTLTCRLLAVADGARSKVRAGLGITARVHDYEQTALVANIQVDARFAGHQAFERFTPDGPLAVLPGPAGRYTVVLARGADAVQQFMEMSDVAFVDALESILGLRLGRLSRVGKRHAYPLALVETDVLVAERAVVMGNAAHSLHPVAGQGFNLALRDVATLVELLANARATDAEAFDAGASAALSAYADWRHVDQRRVVGFTDGLIRGFGNTYPGAGPLRGLGLALFDIAPPAKRLLARQTMGLAGRMTRLARGLSL